MRWPSAYCATSSGIDMASIRESTHPALPSLVRTNVQSSIGTGLAGVSSFFSCFSCPAPGSGGALCDNCNQFGGGGGGGGSGGGPIGAPNLSFCAAFFP